MKKLIPFIPIVSIIYALTDMEVRQILHDSSHFYFFTSAIISALGTSVISLFLMWITCG